MYPLRVKWTEMLKFLKQDFDTVPIYKTGPEESPYHFRWLCFSGTYSLISRLSLHFQVSPETSIASGRKSEAGSIWGGSSVVLTPLRVLWDWTRWLVIYPSPEDRQVLGNISKVLCENRQQNTLYGVYYEVMFEPVSKGASVFTDSDKDGNWKRSQLTASLFG